MARRKQRSVKRSVRKQKQSQWSFMSLGVIVLVLLAVLIGLLVLMRNATEEHVQSYGISESRTLEDLSADMDTIDVDVLDTQTQLLSAQ